MLSKLEALRNRSEKPRAKQNRRKSEEKRLFLSSSSLVNLENELAKSFSAALVLPLLTCGNQLSL